MQSCTTRPLLNGSALSNAIHISLLASAADVCHIAPLQCRYPFLSRQGQFDPQGRTAMQFSMEALTQSRAGFPIAGPFQELLLRTAK
jgi:hypothetical protein